MQLKNEYDLVVAGGGPAGCFMARQAAAEGLDVALLEKKPRKSFGHAWTDDVERSVFKEIGAQIPPPEEWDHQPAETIAIAPDGSYRKRLGGPDVVPLAMAPFVARLANEAEANGATIVDSATAHNLKFGRNGPHTLVFTRDEKEHKIKASIFVDASGIAGVLRNQKGFEGRHRDDMTEHDICTAYRGVIRPDIRALREFALRHDYESGIRYTVLANRGSYSIHLVRPDLEKGELDILVGFKKSYGGTAVEKVKKFLVEEGFGDEKIHGGGGLIPIRHSLDVLVDHRFMIIGDSACQVICAHGSGVASSLIAANLAARTAARALKEGKNDLEALWDYNMEYQRGRGAVMSFFRGSQMLTETFLPSDAAWLIGCGMVSKSDFINAGNARPINPVSGPFSKMRAISKRPNFCLDFIRRAAYINPLMSHYKKYPSVPDLAAVRRWAVRRDELFARITGAGAKRKKQG